MSPTKVNTKKLNYFLVFFFFIISLIRLYFLQVLDKNYENISKKNYVKTFYEIPLRGIIFDRNSKVLAENKIFFKVFIKSSDFNLEKIEKIFDELSLDKSKLKNLKNLTKKNFPYFLINLEKNQWDFFQEKLVFYPFLFVDFFYERNYLNENFCHVLGYVCKITKEELEKKKDKYLINDRIGISGIEASYEDCLKGEKGIFYRIVDVYGRKKEKYLEGKKDIDSKEGQSIVITIDSDLQNYCAKLLKNKKGCIVAIEPFSGEILALISSPLYDSNSLIGENYSRNYLEILKNKDKPFFNRCISSIQPPGSTFKPLVALIALYKKKINFDLSLVCDTSVVGCHNHPKINNICEGLQHSCNPYFVYVLKKVIQSEDIFSNKFEESRRGLEDFEKEVKKFGFGKKLGIDIFSENFGLVPNIKLYDKIYGIGAWKYSNFRSISIGQGEVLTTPLQMANLTCIIANRGFYKRPHLVKKINDKNFFDEEKIEIDYPKELFEIVAKGMLQSSSSGTSFRTYIQDLKVCAKTGTSQNPNGEDHSVTIAFADFDNPKIAVCVLIENAGWGGRAAAAIAGLVIEFYIKREIKRDAMEKFVLDGNFLY